MTPTVLAIGAVIWLAVAVIGVCGGRLLALARLTREEQAADTDRLAAAVTALREATTPIPPPSLRGVATGTGWVDDTRTWPLISDRRRPAAVRAIGGRR